MRDPLPKFHVIVAVALVAGAAAGQTLLWTIPGPPNAPSSQFGQSVAGGGDVNGDGFPDFVVGAPGANAISIYSGYDGTLLHSETGSGSFGASVAILGDANGDGLSDVLIGAPTAVQGSATVGAVRYVFGGSFAGGTGYGPPTPLGYVNPEFGFGAHVAAAGDVNGDGLADAIVSRPGRCEFTFWDPTTCQPVTIGYSYAGDGTVFSGGTFAVLQQVAGSSGEPFARVAAGIGDVDLDGFRDFALLSGGAGGGYTSCFFGASSTCPAFPLRLSVRSGATGAQLWSYSSSWGLKSCLAAVGDLNGDQRSELLVRTNANPSGAIVVVNTILSGVDGSVILTYSENIAPLPGNAVELSCAGVGDVDGDGVADYAMGDAVYFGVQRVRVFSGASHALIYTLNGANNSGFGISIAGLGDLNGDGRGDFAVGIPWYWSPQAVQVFSGASLPVASVISLGGGCGAGGGVPVLTVSPPVIGTSTTIALAGAPYPAAGLLVTSAIPAVPNIVYGGPAYMDQCPVFVDFPTVAVVVSFTTGLAGDWSLVVPLPNVPAIAGHSVALTAGLSPALGGFAASNTVVATPGY